MPLTGFHIGYVLVFFVYGLAFFFMGVSMALEAGRSPMLAERRLLRPLAVFGMLHGMHEWLEIILLQGVWLSVPFPPELNGLRVVLLVASFLPLLLFDLIGLNANKRPSVFPILLVLGLLLVYLTLVINFINLGASDIVARADVLSRYFLSIPGSLMAALAFQARAKQMQTEGRVKIVESFRWAALGFVIYGATQIFVSKIDMFPAMYINSALFSDVFGVPIQVFRAAMAVLITVSLLRAIQEAEQEREQKLLTAQQARLEALEQVQTELLEREKLRKDLLRHTVIAQEDERARIARELHDETSQLLTAFSLDLATLRSSLPKKNTNQVVVNRLADLSRQMSQGIYHLVHDLRPAQLDDLGLIPALQYLVDEVRQRMNLRVTLKVMGERQRLDPLVETVIFRVAQEALTNVGRHAGVDSAEIELSFGAELTCMTITDRGAGFDPTETLRPPHGWGLAGMRERADSIGGKLRIESEVGKGTMIELAIPTDQALLVENGERADGEQHSLDVGG